MLQSDLKSHAVLMSVEGLPSEVLIDIFQKLPVKSLARAMWTCKRWHTIISNPNLVEKHWKDSVKDYRGYLYRYVGDPNIYLFERNRNVSSIDGDDVEYYLDDCAETICMSYGAIGQKLEGSPPNSNVNDHLASSSGGLLAFVNRSENCFCICNPIIGEQIKVPMSPLVSHADPNKYMFYWWALGYSYTSKVYKIIILRNKLEELGSMGFVYTLGLGSSWRALPNDFPFICCPYRYAECDDNLFFICDFGTLDGYKIVSFNIELETYHVLKGPNMGLQPGAAENRHDSPFLLNYGDTVAYANRNWKSFRMWVLRDKVNDIWVNELNASTARIGAYPFLINFHQWIYCGTRFGSQAFAIHHIYDAEQKQFKRIFFPYSKHSDGKGRALYYIYPHLPSLVSPKQIMGVAVPKV